MTGILLDLNHTLVANSEKKISPFIKQIEQEQYREDLIKKIRTNYVILITARPGKYAQATLRSIEGKTGWWPVEWYFNKFGLKPHLCKEQILRCEILPIWKAEELIAIESNPATRAMYLRYRIPAVTYAEYMGNSL